MMKSTVKLFVLVLLVMGMAAPVFATGQKQAAGSVVMTMGSWRHEDVAQVSAMLAAYGATAPGVNIQFRPTNAPEYNATLRLQLDGGNGPDLMYARSYATGEELFRAGHFADCSDIAELKENFTAESLAPWQTADGKTFAVPFAAVSHAIYYNKDIFKKEGLSVPETWEDFLKLCAALQTKGYTALANGIADEWDILECLFLGIVPNFVGGAAERVKYESGEKKFNDAAFIAAWQALADLAKYLPVGYESVTYNDEQILFSSQQAAMLMDVSATIKAYDDVTFDWGLFALPAPAGRKAVIMFHPDMAIAYNTKSAHPSEAKSFVRWLATKEGVAIAAQNMPIGFFPMINAPVQLTDQHAKEFLDLNNGREVDVRFLWPKFMELYTPMNQAVIQVLAGRLTPRQAAEQMESLAANIRK
jgi:raffinose/stachyose/melibiose transport system substrate-binding protein